MTQKRLAIFVVFMFTLVFLLNAPAVCSTTETFEATTMEDIYKTGSDYTTVHNSATGTGTSNGAGAGARTVGQKLEEFTYKIWRTVFEFGTSALPDSANLESAKICLWGEAGTDYSDTDFYIRIQDWTEPTAVTLTDYDAFDGVNYDSGLFSTSSWLENAYNNITINNFNIIGKTTDTYLMLRSSRDINSNAPTGFEMVGIQDAPHYPLLIVSYTSNNVPTNDALTLDLTGANYKGTKTLLTAKQDYKLVYKCSDVDGVTTISYAEIRLDFSSKNVILRATRGTGDSWTFAEQSDPNNYVTLSTCSDSTIGNQKTFNFYVKINWNWGDSAETIGVRAYVIDSQSASDQDDYSNVFGVECHLSSSSLTASDYRCNTQQTLTFSGYWYYNGTMVPPPDGDYQVKIKLDGVQKGSADATLVAGAFSISDVVAESTVNSYTYQAFANYNASAGSFSSVIADKARIYYEQLSDSRIDINTYVEFRARGILLYDGHILGSGDAVTANFGSLTWDPTNSWFDGSRSQSSVGSYIFQVASLSEATYGITSFDVNVTDPTGIWDKGRIYYEALSDSRTSINTNIEFRVKGLLLYDNHAFGSGDTVTANFGSLAWDAVNGWFYGVRSQATAGSYVFQISSLNEATYGVTSFEVNVTNPTGIWDKLLVTYIANTTSPQIDENVQITVSATYSFDNQTVTFLYINTNRNETYFTSGTPFTDNQANSYTYLYTAKNASDNLYGITVFSSDTVTVTWTISNNAPTIGDFACSSTVYAGQYVCVNATVMDIDGRTQIANGTIQLNGTIILKWLNTFNTFSVQSDPNSYVTLNQSACLRTILNDTAYELSWNLKFAWNYPYASVSVIQTNTKVYDEYSYGSNSKSGLFTFEDDLTVASASVVPTEVNPDTNVVFSGAIYYENTTTPPYTLTGITVYLELNGLLQGYTSTVLSNGTWTKTMRSPSNTGNKTYVVYAMTDEMSVVNKSVALFVMSSGPTGGRGGYLPSQPTYRPENYTWAPPFYVPEDVAIPTGLEGLGLNILIIAIAGTTVFGVVSSVVKPSRPTLASKMHVERATPKDYAKRLRRPKRKVKH